MTTFYRAQVNLGSVCPDVTPRRFAELTDVTLADEDTNSILTDNAKKGNPRQCGQHKLRNLVANFANNAPGAT